MRSKQPTSLIKLALFALLASSAWHLLVNMDSHDRLDAFVGICVYLTAGPFHLYAPDSAFTTLSLFLKRLGEPIVAYPPLYGETESVYIPGLAPFHVMRPYGLQHGETRPVLFFFHKGGFVVGEAALERDWAPKFVRKGVIVVSIEYPLAPESVFPSAFDLSTKTVLHLLANPHLVKHGDFSSVGIGGYSAGGNLAAGITRAVQHAAKNALKVHFVASGTLKMHDFNSTATLLEFPSLHLHQHDPTCSLKDLEWFWQMYCPAHLLGAQSCETDARASPLDYAQDVHVPAVVYVGNRDVLFDENKLYSTRTPRSKFFTAKGRHWGSVLLAEQGGPVYQAVDQVVECLFTPACLL